MLGGQGGISAGCGGRFKRELLCRVLGLVWETFSIPFLVDPFQLWYALSVRTFKNTWFTRFARKEGITDDELWAIVNQLEEGQWNADLGGGVYKQRIARPGEGKSGAYRVILFFRSEYRTFFIGGFAKADMANIGKKALIQAKKQAKTLFSMTEEQIEAALGAGIFEEI
jgi:hypothetical protein